MIVNDTTSISYKCKFELYNDICDNYDMESDHCSLERRLLMAGFNCTNCIYYEKNYTCTACTTDLPCDPTEPPCIDYKPIYHTTDPFQLF